jgi:hypothetical protein
VLYKHIDAVRGTSDNPMGRDEVVAKSRDLITPILGAKVADDIIAKTLDLQSLSDLRALATLMRGRTS